MQHDRDSSTAQLHRLAIMRRTDPGPEAERTARIFRQSYGTVRSLRTWKCTTSTMIYKGVLRSHGQQS